MRIGVSGFAWTAAFREAHLHLIPALKDAGFAALEIPMFLPADLPLRALRSAFEGNELEATVCAILPPGINPISPDGAVRSRSLDHLKQCVEATAEMGARLMGGPFFAPIGYLPPHRPTADEFRWAVDTFQALTPMLDELEVMLSLEPVNRSETFFVRTAAEARALCAAIGHPRVGVTIDTFHANIEEKNIATAIENLGPLLRHMHLSENDRGLVGSGHIDFAAILDALRGIDYAGLLMIEGFGYCGDEPAAPGYLWADPQVSPHALAVQGLAFLKRLMESQA